jgi:hypothetical protein
MAVSDQRHCLTNQPLSSGNTPFLNLYPEQTVTPPVAPPSENENGCGMRAECCQPGHCSIKADFQGSYKNKASGVRKPYLLPYGDGF